MLEFLENQGVDLKLVSLAFAAAFLAGPALSGTWETSFQRGMEIYVATVKNGSLTLVCDPDRVYNPVVSYGNFVVSVPVDPRAEQVVFLSITGHQAAFGIQGGIAAQNGADPEAWEKLVSMVVDGGEFAVVTAHDSFTLTMDAMPGFRCM